MTKVCSCKVNPARYLKRARRWLCDDCAKARGFLVECKGEAHSNPYIDNCGVCMPRWGWHPDHVADRHGRQREGLRGIGQAARLVDSAMDHLKKQEAAR